MYIGLSSVDESLLPEKTTGANWQTRIGAVTEASTTLIDTYFLFAPTLDNAFNLKKTTPLGSLPVTIGTGIFSAYVALATALAHTKVNTQNQTDYQAQIRNHTPADSWTRLSREICKNLILFGDGVGHGGENSGFPNGIVSTSAAGYLNRWQMLSVNIAIFIIGFIISYSDIRTCKHSHDSEALDADAQNTPETTSETQDSAEENNADFWTKIGLIGFAYRTAFTLIVLIGQLFDRALAIENNTPIGVSATVLPYAILAALLITPGAANCERILNTNYQQPIGSSITIIRRAPLPLVEKISLMSGIIAQGANFSAPILLIINLATNEKLSGALFAALSLILTVSGCILTSANSQTYYNQMQRGRSDLFFSTTKEITCCSSICNRSNI